MSQDDTAGTSEKRKLRYYFLRPDYDVAERPPPLELKAGSRRARRRAKRRWEIEQGGRFHTWVYLAALVAVLVLMYVLIFVR